MERARIRILLGGLLLVFALHFASVQAGSFSNLQVFMDKDLDSNFCFDTHGPQLDCSPERGVRPLTAGMEDTSKRRKVRKRWIIFKSKDTILKNYVSLSVDPILKEDNAINSLGPNTNGSRVVMEFEFKLSQIAKAVSVDATVSAFEKIENQLMKSKGEFGIQAPVFIHPDQISNSGKISYDHDNHPKAYLGTQKQIYDTVTLKDCGVDAKYPVLEKDDWGVRAVINVGTGFQKKVPRVPISREFYTRVFVIGQGIDKQARNAPELENTLISNGFKVLEDRYAKISMNQEPVGNNGAGLSNLATYQAQVIASISKHAEIIPIVLSNPDEHTADVILRAFEAVFELAKLYHPHKKTLVTFSGKVISSSKYDSYRFTEFIGKLLNESNVVMTYGIDEEAELRNIRTIVAYKAKLADYKSYLHIGWYPYVLSVMALNRDLHQTTNQQEIYYQYTKLRDFKIIFAPAANVYVPYITAKGFHPVYRGKYCYVDNSISAATAVAVQSMYLSSIAFKYVKHPFFVNDVVVQRSMTKVFQDSKALNLLFEFCSIIDKYVFSSHAGTYKCVPQYGTVHG